MATPSEVACQACGTQNRSEARFCKQCGAELQQFGAPGEKGRVKFIIVLAFVCLGAVALSILVLRVAKGYAFLQVSQWVLFVLYWGLALARLVLASKAPSLRARRTANEAVLIAFAAFLAATHTGLLTFRW